MLTGSDLAVRRPEIDCRCACPGDRRCGCRRHPVGTALRMHSFRPL